MLNIYAEPRENIEKLTGCQQDVYSLITDFINIKNIKNVMNQMYFISPLSNDIYPFVSCF